MPHRRGETKREIERQRGAKGCRERESGRTRERHASIKKVGGGGGGDAKASNVLARITLPCDFEKTTR
jgi:hypothetical protein